MPLKHQPPASGAAAPHVCPGARSDIPPSLELQSAVVSKRIQTGKIVLSENFMLFSSQTF